MSSAASADRARPLVLVVDDDETTRMVFRAAIEAAGMDCAEALDGPMGLDAFDTHRPDAVVLDLIMPGLDGFDVCQALRARSGGRHVPVLVLTGLDDDTCIVRAYDVGATDFATKPVHPIALGHRLRFLLRSRDVQAQLVASEARLELAQRIARLGHFEWWPTTDRLVIHAELARLLDVQPDAMTSSATLLARVPPEARAAVATAWHAAIATGTALHVRHHVVRDDGRVLSVETQGIVRRDEPSGEPLMLGTVQDVSERDRAEARIEYLSQHDLLTGLPNRTLFAERATAQLARSTGGIALLFIDVDRFGRLNESYGPSTGDAVLRAIARRLEASSFVDEPGASAVVRAPLLARHGGDQFVAMVTGCARGEDVLRAARRLLDEISAAIEVGPSKLFVTACVGVARFTEDGSEIATLLANAEAAARHAKSLGSGRIHWYAPELNAAAGRRARLESEVRSAVERESFEVHYQPKLHVGSMRIGSLEALVRFTTRSGERVSPADFLPVAEDAGLIAAVDAIVLEKALTELAGLHRAGFSGLKMAVNLSHASFWDPALTARVLAALARSGVPADALELELTETIVMRDVGLARPILDALRATGIRLSLDDFGTGQTSLHQLRHLPIHVLKVDRAFVRGLPGDAADAAIAGAVVTMARGLGLEVVAEGVETGEQFTHLAALGCDFIQGFLISPPRPPEALGALLSRDDSELTDGYSFP